MRIENQQIWVEKPIQYFDDMPAVMAHVCFNAKTGETRTIQTSDSRSKPDLGCATIGANGPDQPAHTDPAGAAGK